MRPKFRAWDKDRKSWLNTLNLTMNLEGELMWVFGDFVKDYLGRPDNVVLMQCTGLLDSKGKEIYEGDILKNKVNGILYEIFWNKKALAFGYINKIFKKPVKHPLWQIEDLLDRLEVIGNIYEYKDLIKP